MDYEDSNNEHQSLIKYPATDNERMNIMVDFFLHSEPFRKWDIGEITKTWETLNSHQLKHIVALLTESNLFVVFSKKWHKQFMLKENAREQIISEGSYKIMQ